MGLLGYHRKKNLRSIGHGSNIALAQDSPGKDRPNKNGSTEVFLEDDAKEIKNNVDLLDVKKDNDKTVRAHSRRSNRLFQRLSGSFHDISTNQTNRTARNILLMRRNSISNNKESLLFNMDHIPDLILDLDSAVSTSADRPARALRALFALSEQNYLEPTPDNDTYNDGCHERRIEMVHGTRTKKSNYDSDPIEHEKDYTPVGRLLVPTLLNFLIRCKPKSNEQYMTLLVLNNISVPAENKKVIALDCGGIKTLAKLLCEDPSCHLLVIVLVNLTFTDAELRQEIISSNTSTELVESLAFVLRIASLTKDEYEARITTIEQDCYAPELHDMPLVDKLAILMAEDQRIRSNTQEEQQSNNIPMLTSSSPYDHLSPETARWCLSAIRNLTRPCKNADAAHILIKSGAYALILQYVSIRNIDASKSEPIELRFGNEPYNWDSNSMQDIALSVIMNLSACSTSREYINELHTVKILSMITKYRTRVIEDGIVLSMDQTEQLKLQCTKAIMALSYLIGSQGHFGQSKIRPTASTVQAHSEDSVLVMVEDDVYVLYELLDNVIHHRGKDNPGGYSSTSFSLKDILFAVRCFLTHMSNQMLFMELLGERLNTLLMKTLAHFVLYPSNSFIDAESAEYACFSLYLLSNYCFEDVSFLPAVYAPPNKETEDSDADDLATRILISYLRLETISSAGRHAAEQLVLRMKYLNFGRGNGDVQYRPASSKAQDHDSNLDPSVINKLKKVEIGTRTHGDKPCNEIFHRSILRSRKPRNGSETKAPWKNMATVSVFPSVLQAVQQLSFGSIKVRHVDPIDDIKIANHIANSANGQRTESYNFLWIWEDKASLIQRNLERQTSIEEKNSSLFNSFSRSEESKAEGGSLLRLSCGMCAADTTVS